MLLYDPLLKRLIQIQTQVLLFSLQDHKLLLQGYHLKVMKESSSFSKFPFLSYLAYEYLAALGLIHDGSGVYCPGPGVSLITNYSFPFIE